MSFPKLHPELPIPPHFDSHRVGEIWRVPYQERAEQARQWARQFDLPFASQDELKIALVVIDVQNTFCIPGFELFVGGRSGKGAVEDNCRLCEFIYRNLGSLTQITATMDTHRAMQIFHPIFLIDEAGNHPAPMTLVSYEDVVSGKWRFNPAVAPSLKISPEYGQRHLLHYTATLREHGKYDLTIWPYHAMLGGIGHALTPAVEEAIFFHSIARYSQAEFEDKGELPLTENYSALSPEVLKGPDGKRIGKQNIDFLGRLLVYDAVVLAGQAKSHCVAWTIDDLLGDIRARDEKLARKVYLLEDCASPVVVPGIVDYTEQADAAYARFADAGMHVVRSTDPIESWPGLGG